MDVPVHEIVQALENDAQLDFKVKTPKQLNKGLCPSCGERELYISIDQPYQMQCARANNCGYSETTHSRYPHLWENLSKRVPATEQNPNATADAFLQNRGFNTAKIAGIYSQQIRKFKALDESFINADVVRFHLSDQVYWDRIINEKDVRLIGCKALVSAGAKYKGNAWQMPNKKIGGNDRVFITEGIFHSIALILAGHQSVASISSSNFPWDVIKKHKAKNIEWVIAYDDDNAGRTYAKKYHKQMLEEGYQVKVALTGSSKDWDDIYKAGELTDKFINDSIWRGNMFTAKSVTMKAWFNWLKYESSRSIIDFNNKLYQITVDNDALKKSFGIDPEQQDLDQSNIQEAIEKSGFEMFAGHMKSYSISNCYPIFKYCESDKITGEIAYFFEIKSPHNPTQQISISGSAVESPSSFNKAILNKAPGAKFNGDAKQMKIISDKWFDKKIEIVETVPFIGYDKQSNLYIFPDFAYSSGTLLKPNQFGYFTKGNTRIKTTFKNIKIETNSKFNNEWFEMFLPVFSWNGLVTLSFWVGSLFAEQIRSKHSSWPFLEMTGIPGTGKTLLLEFLWKCVGRDDYEGFDPSKATFPARSRAFIQTANLPLVLIEGDRDKDAKKGAFDYNELKTAYNGRAVRAMGAFNRGNETIEPPFRGSIVIAQNKEVDAEAAVIERIVHLNFTKEHFTPKAKQLSKIIDNICVEDVCGLLSEALSKESLILNTFEEQFKRIDKIFTENGNLKNDRVIKTHAMIGAMAHALVHLFPQMHRKQSCGRTLADKTVDYLESRGIQRELRLINDNPLVVQFWETYELLENCMTGDGGDTRVNHSNDDKVIAINLPAFFKMAKRHGFDLPHQNEMKPLLKTGTTFKFLGSNQSVKSSIVHGKNFKCWKFSAEKKRG